MAVARVPSAPLCPCYQVARRSDRRRRLWFSLSVFIAAASQRLTPQRARGLCQGQVLRKREYRQQCLLWRARSSASISVRCDSSQATSASRLSISASGRVEALSCDDVRSEERAADLGACGGRACPAGAGSGSAALGGADTNRTSRRADHATKQQSSRTGLSGLVSLAHLLAAALEVLAFELPRLVICLGEVIGVDKAIATPETTERLLAVR